MKTPVDNSLSKNRLLVTLRLITASSLFGISLLGSPALMAAPPACLSADSDTDGDGWGWENNTSCKVAVVTECIDTDGDGWGWNGQMSCLVIDTTCVDTDGDGWGWNGTKSCKIADTEPTACTDSPPLNDTWGWNGLNSCRLAPVFEPQDTSAIAGFWDGSDEDESYYVLVRANGTFIAYESYSDSDDCFYVEDPNSKPELHGQQIFPLGDNLYEFYTYDLRDDDLQEAREQQSVEVTEADTLKVGYQDMYDDDEDGDIDEYIYVELPRAPGTPEDLILCNV